MEISGWTPTNSSRDQVGQCNDAYGAVVIATKLAEALECGSDEAYDATWDLGKNMENQWDFVGFEADLTILNGIFLKVWSKIQIDLRWFK